jgi:hypothetical protein
VCHTDQILKKGGLKDENTIVFMYDDIAHNLENSNPGTITMLIYFICGTSTVRLQRDQSTRKAKSKGRVGEHNGLDCSDFIVLMYCAVCCLGTTSVSSFSDHSAYAVLQKGEAYRSCRCGISTKFFLKMFQNI